MYERYENDATMYRPRLNPEFAKKAQAKRKAAEREAKIAAAKAELEAKRKAQEEAVARLKAKEAEVKAVQKAARTAVSQYRVITVIKPAGAPLPQNSAADIIRMVATAHGFTVQEILGQSRSRPLVAARHAAIRAVADARPEWGLIRIGHVFGKDHTTILHALRKTEKPRQHYRQAA